MRADFWIFVALVFTIAIGAIAAKHVPVMSRAMQEASQTEVTCKGACGTHWIVAALGPVAVIGLVTLIFASIGRKAKP